MTAPRSRAVTVAASLIFLAYAGCFLYFFVDDEAIPLVYARNLLRGRGLAYTVLEGRVEGYSDFLHVLWSAVLLAITRAFRWPALTPLLIGKGVSLAAGVGIIVLLSRALAARGVRLAAVAAALAVTCLAGPLAVWSASSLETTVFALTVLAFTLALVDERQAASVVLGMLLVLERIDGAVYVIAISAAVLAASRRRWRFVVRTAVLIGLTAASYHVWRYSYFHAWLSAPIAAKVMHRVAAPARALVKAPDITYFGGLIAIYGWTGVIVFAAAAVAAVRDELGRVAVLTLLALGFYAERVDDWMFGWRFAVALVPFAAIVIGSAIDRLPRRLAAIAAVLVTAWSGVAATAFLRTYQDVEGRPVFWTAPRGGEQAWLGRYAELLLVGRGVMHPGDRVAYNQAGLLAYALDVENVDDLGICSRFVADLPTTDVYYTGVGRYSPLTNAPVVHTAHAYLLYRNVQFLVTPIDLLLKANGGHIPDRLLDDAFVRVDDPRLRENVLYRRTAKPIDRYARDPLAFTENVTHYTHVQQAVIDGRPLSEDEIGPRLPFVRELGSEFAYGGSWSMDLTFAATDETVTAIFIAAASSSVPATLGIVLHDAAGRVVYSSECPLTAAGAQVLYRLPSGTRAAALTLSVHGTGAGRLRLADVRVEGQTPALSAYIERMLRFPSPQW
jgi:hypothetical protein